MGKTAVNYIKGHVACMHILVTLLLKAQFPLNAKRASSMWGFRSTRRNLFRHFLFKSSIATYRDNAFPEAGIGMFFQLSFDFSLLVSGAFGSNGFTHPSGSLDLAKNMNFIVTSSQNPDSVSQIIV